MDEERKPRSREKKIVNEGRGVEKRGEGLGTGPVGSAGTYEDRKSQSAPQPKPRQTDAARPVNSQSGFTQPTGSPYTQSRPQQTGSARPMGSPFTQSRPQQTGSTRPTGSPFTQSRPQQTGSARPTGSPFTQSRPQQTGSARPMNTQNQGASSSGSRQSAPQRGGGSKLILIIIALVVLLGGGKLSGLFGGDGSDLPSGLGNLIQDGGGSDLPSGLGSVLQSGGNSGSSQSSGSSSSQSGYGSLGLDQTGTSGSSGLTDLLSTFLGSSSSSPYDFTGDPFSLLSGSGSLSGSSGSGSSSASATTLLSNVSGGSAEAPDTTVVTGAREKYTVLKGRGRDTVTILVYLCGTDLESQNGMGTSDLKEMTSATLGSKVNLIVYTGGCRRWRNNVVSSSVNQIYQIQDGKLYCLEKDMGSASMTSPKTLSSFIKYGAENFPANRMCLILWDHGSGSASGYGYDEKYASSGSMSLAGINSALKDAGQKFDFIGFDACLMATVENGLMLSQYADYMIASEETEPGVGWYYTNWLTKLGSNTSISTVELGKMIADDFVAVCARQCRGQGTTLSVVDLAELQATVPSSLSDFGKGTNELIQNQEYKTVAAARSKTREFAQSTRIDQIDLVHFATNMGTKEGKALASAITGAVKYNRTGGSINNAYGLSIYFPYKRAGKLSQVVSTYQAIGMDTEYTRCIQEFASLELSGQAAAGTSMYDYSSQSIGSSSLLNSLLGGYSGSGYSGGIPSSSGDMTDLLGGLFGGSSLGSSSDLFSIFSGRSMTAERAADYLSAHHLDASQLVWNGNRMTLSSEQWREVESLCRNVFVQDTQGGFIDLGLDSEFTLEGDSLIDDFDGTWLSIDGQPVAYYYLGTEDDGENYVITGYVPAFLNDSQRVNLMLLFDNEHPYGIIDGAEPVYAAGETQTVAKTLIQIGQGDKLQFICDYYDHEGNYQDSYLLGDPVILGAETEIANTPIGNHPVRVTYCFTDYYQQRYWTPVRD